MNNKNPGLNISIYNVKAISDYRYLGLLTHVGDGSFYCHWIDDCGYDILTNKNKAKFHCSVRNNDVYQLFHRRGDGLEEYTKEVKQNDSFGGKTWRKR